MMRSFFRTGLLFSIVLGAAQLLWAPQPVHAQCSPGQAPNVIGPSGTVLDARPNFQWTPVTNAQSYTLYALRVSDEAVLLRQTGLTSTSFRPAAPLPSDVPMRWKVKSENVCGAGPYSASTYFTIQAGGPPCPPTQAPVAVSPSGGSISDTTPTFSWQAVPSAQSYTLYVLRESDDAIVLRETGITGLNHTPAGPLPTNVSMRWKVKSESVCGPGPYSSSINFTIRADGPPCPPTQAPVALSPSGGTLSDSTPTFAWLAVPGAQSYTLYVQRASDGAVVHRATGITTLSHTPSAPLPTNLALRWKMKSESVCGPGPYSPPRFFDIADDRPRSRIDFGYYQVDSHIYGYYLGEVTNYTNLVHIGPRNAGFASPPTPPAERIPILADQIERAAAAGMNIMLDLEFEAFLNNRQVLRAARPYWNSVKYIILADEPGENKLSVEDANRKIANLRRTMRRMRLDDSKPIGVTLTPNQALREGLINADFDFINIEAYSQPCPCGNCGTGGTAEEEIRDVENRINQMKTRIPASKFLTVVMQGYDRNGRFTNPPVLTALNRATYFRMVRGDPRVRALVIFSYGRRGTECRNAPEFGYGSRGYPQLRSVHREIWDDINRP